jgi:hypothetical protein
MLEAPGLGGRECAAQAATGGRGAPPALAAPARLRLSQLRDTCHSAAVMPAPTQAPEPLASLRSSPALLTTRADFFKSDLEREGT